MRIYKDLYEKLREITLTDFEVDYKKDPDDEYVYVYSEIKMNSMIEELLGAYDSLQEQFDDYKEDVRENYKQIPRNYYAEYGISEKDFS